MSRSDPALQAFTAVVLADPAVQDELRRTPDQATFVALMIERSRQHGCAVDAAGIAAALDAGLDAWRKRWIER